MDAFKDIVHQALRSANAIIVLDRFFPNSIKTSTRTQRSGSSRVYKLTPAMQTPPKQVVLTNTKNKIHLNAMFTEGILNPGYFIEATQTHTITIACPRDVPVEIKGYRNSKPMAVNGMVRRLCKEEKVGYVDLWDRFVGKEEMYARDGLHLSGRGASVFAEGLSGAVASGLGKVRYLN